MKLSLDSLARRLEQPLLPVYLISGDEPLLTGEAADSVRARARELGFSEREVHVLDRSADWEAVRAAAGTLSLFGSRRIIELKLPTGKAGVTGGRVLSAAIESAGGDVLLLILTGRLDRDAQNAEWVRAAEARGAWITVWPVARGAMVPWLEARCRRLGLTLDREALEALAEHTEGNLLAAQQELEKLVLLAGSGRITAEQLLAGISQSARFSVAELSDALVAGDLPRALRVLSGLETEGVELPLVLWALTRAIHDLWACHTGSDSAPARGWPRRATPDAETRRRAARLPFDRIVARAVRADRMAKGRLSGDAWGELSLLAAELCGRPALGGRAAAESRAALALFAGAIR
ncbi:MAG: DNA polymerase III subunit delta [Steroidobacteraceae bacterium]